MQVDNECDYDKAETLAIEFTNAVNRDPSLTHTEILLALLMAVGDTIAAIDCRDCRKAAVKGVKKILPRTITTALSQTAGQPSTTHCH
jgi:hypothetical protein